MLRLIIFLIIIGNLSSTVNAQKSIENLVKNYLKSHQIPGAVVGILKSDNLTHAISNGLADVQNNAEVNDSTSFELGSLSKQFTACAILRLHQDQKLNIEDYIHIHFPACPDHWKEIKIKHLIWHTSGLPGMFPHDAFTQPSFTGYTKMDASTLDHMMQTNNVNKEIAIQSIVTDSLDFKPGTKYNYSDVGYLVLGIIIDNITGSYRKYMLNSIFNVANLNNTYILNQEKVILNQARGYSLKNGELINIMRTWEYEIPSYFGIFSTVEDLLKWNQVLETNLLLNEQNRSLLFSQGRLENGKSINYGFGWEINKINGVKIISHKGVTGTSMVKVPSKDFCMVLLTNLGYNGNEYVNPWGLSKEIMDFYNIETTTNRNHITTDGRKVILQNNLNLENLDGDYSTSEGIKATIFIENNIPYFENNGIKFELALLDQNSWLVLGMEFEYILTFNRDEGSLTSNYGRIYRKQK